MKMVLEDELQALLFLCSLPESWENLMVSLSNSAPDEVVSMSQVASSLLNEEIQRKCSSSSHSPDLLAENRGGVKTGNLTIMTSQKEDQKLEKISLLIIVKRADI